jgi:hypothetical protein
MRAADLFEQGVIPAEVARQVGASHPIVSDWRTRDGLGVCVFVRNRLHQRLPHRCTFD